MSKTTAKANRSPRDQRRLLQLNQSAYWSRVGVTQSGGSRYESGRNLPKPVQTLLDLAYGSDPLATLAKLRNTTVDELLGQATPTKH